MHPRDSSAALERPRPSFLVILTDQQRADHVGFGGNDVVHTPNLDRLAARGTVFDRAFVSNPTCAPNRATIFTGMAPTAHGVRINGIPLDPDTRTFPRILRSHGWRTAAVGKLHFQNMGTPLDAESAGVEAWRRERPTRWDGWEDLERHRHERVPIPPDYYGFDHVDLITGHSDYATGHYYAWARERGAELDRVRGAARSPDPYPGWSEVYQSALPEELYTTSYVTDRALARLDELTQTDDPFLLVCSYPDPHHPFTPPGRYWGLYDPAAMPLPRTFDDPHRRSPPHIRRLVECRGVTHRLRTWAPTADQYRHALAAQYGMITMIDDSVGTILTAVERAGLASSLVVIFTSDHGDLFGDHGLLLKHATHYEGCTRVPLAIAGPRVSPRRVGDLCGSIDLAATILALAGLPVHLGDQGTSLVPHLQGDAPAPRTGHLITEDEPGGFPGLVVPARLRTVVTEHARLTLYVGAGTGELYDHDADPDELHNLYGLPAHAELQGHLLCALAEALTLHESTGLERTARA